MKALQHESHTSHGAIVGLQLSRVGAVVGVGDGAEVGLIVGVAVEGDRVGAIVGVGVGVDDGDGVAQRLATQGRHWLDLINRLQQVVHTSGSLHNGVGVHEFSVTIATATEKTSPRNILRYLKSYPQLLFSCMVVESFCSLCLGWMLVGWMHTCLDRQVAQRGAKHTNHHQCVLPLLVEL